ncbi:MAG TPA: sigma-70 family RNA polymerase sigma factor [Phycisphaerales bacterium]|nr:sigma-70 family RNA polymerase sigma factor [Phycisphaerales bacterium]
MSEPVYTVESLVIEHRGVLDALVRREAGIVLLRFESVDDLVQGISQEAIRSSKGFTYGGPSAFASWLTLIGRRYLSARRDYWLAHKRNPGNVLRLTVSGSGTRPRPRAELADTATGPATFAFRREQLILATRAMAMLLPRDREIITMMSEGLQGAQIAERLGVSLDAAEKARTRAVERLRKAFELLGQKRGSSLGDSNVS